MTPRRQPERLTLTERRKADTRMEIARTAARLFAENGANATTAEEIARTAGVALRTFYRYFRAKEDAVEPVLAAGALSWLTPIADGPRELPGPAALESIAVRALTPADAEAVEAMRTTRGLLRAAEDDADLRAVWQRLNLDTEQQLRGILAELSGPSGEGADSLRIRLIAAAASTAIRVAIESWSAAPGEDAPVTGPGSPSDLVVRCMRELTAGLPDAP